MHSDKKSLNGVSFASLSVALGIISGHIGTSTLYTGSSICNPLLCKQDVEYVPLAYHPANEITIERIQHVYP